MPTLLLTRVGMGVLSVVVADPVVCAHLSKALSRRFHLVVHDSWDEFEEQREDLDPAAVIVDLYHPRGPQTVDHIVDASRSGGFGVVACSAFDGKPQDLYALGAAGVGGVILPAELSNGAGVRVEVERAVARAVAEDVVSCLPGEVPALARTALRWTVGNATVNGSVRELSAELGYSPGSLRRRFQRAGLPNPTRTLMWGRLLFAARELARRAPVVEQLAHRLGYASRSGLTRLVSRELGLPPSVLRGEKALTIALDRFVSELRAS